MEGCDLHPHTGLDVLVGRALVVISSDGVLEMHDLLEEMGREIVRQESSIKEPGRRSRLWSYEDVHHVLTQKTATEAVESIIVHWPHGDNVVKLNTAFVEMTKLRLLKVYTHYLRPPIRKSVDQWKYEDLKFLFKKLSYLFWDKCPLKSLSSNFNPELLLKLTCNIVGLNTSGKELRYAVVVKAILSDLKQSRHEEEKNEKAVAASRRGGRIWDCICGSRGDGD
ncbi:TMV resistance protein N-like [Pyrus ussuriensis x Pyrus communis]|uniref:TMV resistance protein N-like n=1 Tax=Pyrus ussuriensis x Pyrus communis TaxID=2448454 RepID=A0A5N5HGP4_9ROSA|nr:TMV resistance protein N-like [Pyrus ussuriensis x Pyrus communis]